MNTPDWALTIAFWLHMLATVTWIGGLATLAMIVLPLARKALDPDAFAKLLRAINKRLDPLGWFGLAVLTGTGMLQMAANPNYEGLLAVTNPWAQAILIKHIAFIAIIGISAYQTWGLTPALEFNALLLTKGKGDETKGTQLQKRGIQMMWFNLALGVLVLLLTALARVNS